nr:coiled-coil domain-containing protein 57-like [Vicugna pacos]
MDTTGDAVLGASCPECPVDGQAQALQSIWRARAHPDPLCQDTGPVPLEGPLASMGSCSKLEHPAPPAAYSLQHPEGSPTRSWVAFAIEGMKMEAQARGKPTGHPRARPAKPQGCQRPPKIRNYNSKE